VLLGSARFLLMDRVRESLAGRAFVYELWPLMAHEIRTPRDREPEPPLIAALSREPEDIGNVLAEQPEVLLVDEEDEHRRALEHLASWGGMPELLRLGDSDRREWLRSYQQTWLERDLTDLTRLNDLLPFRSLQRLAMLRSAQLLSYSELARDAQLSVSTVRRYLEYLRLSYQVLLLPPFSRNLTSQVVKTPKLYWMDLGLLRHGTNQWGPATGPLFETLVVSEMHKWLSTTGSPVELSFYRTRSGLEVDLLLRTENGLIGLEVKGRERLGSADMRGLRAVAEAAGDAWRGGIVVTPGGAIRRLNEAHRLWRVPAHRLF
jgi:hypothetical protein